VGNKQQRVGLLFLGFARSPFAFLSSQKLLLVSFAQAIAPHLTAYYLETLREGFMRSTVDVHRFLSEEELGRGEIQRKLTEFGGNGHHEIRKVLAGILAVQDRVYAATTARLPDFERTTLHEELLKFEGDLKTQARYKDRRITYRIDEAINNERPELQVILYRFMTEAIVNGLLHGEATAVFLRLVRLREKLILTVVDNGRGFDPVQLSTRTVPPDPGSILALSEHIKECNGGTGIDWGWTAKGLGTFIRITIPLFPDPTAPQTPITQDWIDTMEAVPNAWLTQKEARR
jgi:hypothetical protein